MLRCSNAICIIHIIQQIAGNSKRYPEYRSALQNNTQLCASYLTVGEYIRARRMTLAAQELSCSDCKVIDIAMKYGYDSPDSFAKAFQRFHGITPSQARETGANLRSIAPLHIKITLEGGNMLDYKIVEKAPFTVVGIKKRFHSETSYKEVPEFWSEWMSDMKGLKGMFGVCSDMDGKIFDYSHMFRNAQARVSEAIDGVFGFLQKAE